MITLLFQVKLISESISHRQLRKHHAITSHTQLSQLLIEASNIQLPACWAIVFIVRTFEVHRNKDISQLYETKIQ